MDRLTTIEESLIDLLETIEAGEELASGYIYYTTTGQADLADMALSESLNNENSLSGVVNHLVVPSEDGEETAEWDIGQNVYTNVGKYEIRSQVYCDPDDENPRRALKTAGNEVLSDIRALLGYNHTLGGEVNWCRILSNRFEYSENGDRIGGGTQITEIEIEYSQQLLNPDIATC